MVDLHDYDIELIEREILWKYNDNRQDYSNCDCLLSLRKDMINKRVLAHQEEILQDIIAFNDALRDALKEMYDRAHCIWDSIKENAWGDDVEVTAKSKMDGIVVRLVTGTEHEVLTEDENLLCNLLAEGRKYGDLILDYAPALSNQVVISYAAYNSNNPLVK